MGLFNLFKQCVNSNEETINTLIKLNRNSMIATNIKAVYNKKFYFSNNEINKIDNDFIEHDGYFTKLIVNQKVIGYIFRCTHKNVELVNSINNEKRIIPFLVTCIYQPALPFTSNKIIKTLGKSQCLKTGVRSIQQYIKNTNDLNLDCFIESMTDVTKVFPEYDLIKDSAEFIEFTDLTLDEYNNTLDYIKSFDKKIYKYYSGIDEKNILKIWLKN